MAFLNRVALLVSSTGTGNLTFSGALPGNLTMSEAGAANGASFPYIIDNPPIGEGDFEIGWGTWNSGTGAFSRDAVTISKIAGVVGTAKIDVAAGAECRIGVRAEDLAGMLAQIATKSNKKRPHIPVTGNISLNDTTHDNAVLVCHTANVQITVPSTLSDGFQCEVIRWGAFTVQFVQGSGATLLSSDSKLKLNKQGSGATIYSLGGGSVWLGGDLAT